MDSKRVLLATVLCMGILFGWTWISDIMGWTPTPPVQTVQETTPPPLPNGELNTSVIDPLAGTSHADTVTTATAPAIPAAAAFKPAEGHEIIVETPLYTAKIHSGGAVLTSFKLKNYTSELAIESSQVEMISPQASLVSPMGILLSGQPTWHVASWETTAQNLNLLPGQKSQLVFTGKMGEVTITRTLTFSADTYLIDEKLDILSNTANTARVSYSLASTSLASPDNSYDRMRLVWDNGSLEEDQDVKDLTKEGLLEQGTFNWAGVASNYFLAAVAPTSTSKSALKARIQNDIWRVALEESDIILQPLVPVSLNAYWWFGPKERDLLKVAPNKLGSSTDMGMFTFIALPMVWIMQVLNSFVDNWGIAIIILTILIKLLFWPLTKSSYTSMEKMKRIQPMLQDLQKKYANDKEALSREMMQLYKTYGVNPMGGCLPIIIQIPVFFALYQALLQSIELRHSAFITFLPFTDKIWLADLSAKDPFYITPIIMGATMFLQQLMAPAVGDPMQRRMMLIMPVIFTFMFLNFPSGLVLYWLVSNVLSIGQQWYTLHKIK